jgi:hypothetical protein
LSPHAIISGFALKQKVITQLEAIASHWTSSGSIGAGGNDLLSNHLSVWRQAGHTP